MSAVQSLTELLEIKDFTLSKAELMVLEAELFIHTYEAIKEIIKKENKDYFRLFKLNKETENSMIEESFIRCVINDILSTEEYTLPGIAYYTDTPEDIIYEVASGNNTNPTLSLTRKIINLHRSVRPKLYREILNKIRIENSISITT